MSDLYYIAPVPTASVRLDPAGLRDGADKTQYSYFTSIEWALLNSERMRKQSPSKSVFTSRVKYIKTGLVPDWLISALPLSLSLSP